MVPKSGLIYSSEPFLTFFRISTRARSFPVKMATNFQNDLLLLTGASGRQVTTLLPLLKNKWRRLRLVVYSESSKQKLASAHPEAEVVQADLTNPTDCQKVVQDVTAAYHILPAFHPNETQIGTFLIDACVAQSESGGPFKHFVFSSVICPILQKLLNHDCKRYVEEHLMESGLNYTILQPSHLIDMFPIQKLASSKEPVFPARFNPDVRFSYTTLMDNAEVAAKVLQEREKHYFATYPLISSRTLLSYREVCEMASKRIGKQIRVERVSFEEIANGGDIEAAFGLRKHPATRDSVQRMLLYYNFRGLKGNPNITEWILGREATGVEKWLEEKLKH